MTTTTTTTTKTTTATETIVHHSSHGKVGGGGVGIIDIPLSIAHLVAVNLEYAVLLCIKPRCKRAQTVTGLEEHLRRFHREKQAIRKEAAEFGQRLVWLDERFVRSYEVVELPVDGLAPQPLVPVVDRFSCRFCRFLTINRSVLRKHVREKHSKKGEKDERICVRVRIQSWYGAKRARYWTVNDAAAGADDGTSRQEEEGTQGAGFVRKAMVEPQKALDELNGIREDVERWREEAIERRHTLQGKPEVQELESWLNFTKWRDVLSCSNHGILHTYEYLRYPGPDKPALCRLLRPWGLVKARALQTLEDVDHKDALKWWVTPKNEVASQHSFELPQNSNTLGKYSRIWEQFICYMVRTVPTDSSKPTETGVVFSAEQRLVIKRHPGSSG